MLKDEWWWLRNGRCQGFLNFLAWAPQRVMLLAERRGRIQWKDRFHFARVGSWSSRWRCSEEGSTISLELRREKGGRLIFRRRPHTHGSEVLRLEKLLREGVRSEGRGKDIPLVRKLESLLKGKAEEKMQ